ncbi:hypothetical protein H4582DRAFT_2052108 [Lactarius indigo]|nr:hypothetical protein H4582DRAFT_2052108 [Lactarius indigo]
MPVQLDWNVATLVHWQFPYLIGCAKSVGRPPLPLPSPPPLLLRVARPSLSPRRTPPHSRAERGRAKKKEAQGARGHTPHPRGKGAKDGTTPPRPVAPVPLWARHPARAEGGGCMKHAPPPLPGAPGPSLCPQSTPPRSCAERGAHKVRAAALPPLHPQFAPQRRRPFAPLPSWARRPVCVEGGHTKAPIPAAPAPPFAPSPRRPIRAERGAHKGSRGHARARHPPPLSPWPRHFICAKGAYEGAPPRFLTRCAQQAGPTVSLRMHLPRPPAFSLETPDVLTYHPERSPLKITVTSDTEHVRVGMLSKQLKTLGNILHISTVTLALIRQNTATDHLSSTSFPSHIPVNTTNGDGSVQVDATSSPSVPAPGPLATASESEPDDHGSECLPGYRQTEYSMHTRSLSGNDKRAASFPLGFPPSLLPQPTYPMRGDESTRSLMATSSQQEIGRDNHFSYSPSDHDARPTMSQPSVYIPVQHWANYKIGRVRIAASRTITLYIHYRHKIPQASWSSPVMSHPIPFTVVRRETASATLAPYVGGEAKDLEADLKGENQAGHILNV